MLFYFIHTPENHIYLNRQNHKFVQSKLTQGLKERGLYGGLRKGGGLYVVRLAGTHQGMPIIKVATSTIVSFCLHSEQKIENLLKDVAQCFQNFNACIVFS